MVLSITMVQKSARHKYTVQWIPTNITITQVKKELYQQLRSFLQAPFQSLTSPFSLSTILISNSIISKTID